MVDENALEQSVFIKKVQQDTTSEESQSECHLRFACLGSHSLLWSIACVSMDLSFRLKLSDYNHLCSV